MLKIKPTITALLAVTAFSALIAAPASANWFVNGAELKTTAALSTTAKVDEFSRILIPSLEDLTIECTGSTIDSDVPLVNGTNGTGEALSLIFFTCNTIKPATGCALAEKNETVSTLPVSIGIDLHGATEDRVLFTPQTKKTFANINFGEANTCALAGTQPIKGSVTTGAPTGQTEELTQAIVDLGSVENNSLEAGTGNKTFISGGKALLTLASGSKWSFK